jgi:hypothetical protein
MEDCLTRLRRWGSQQPGAMTGSAAMTPNQANWL